MVLMVAIAALQVMLAAGSCPLDFSVLNRFTCDPSRNKCGSCSDIWNRLNFVVAEHARQTQVFLLSLEDAQVCMLPFQVQLGVTVDAISSCGISPSVLAENSTLCPDIKTVEDYRNALSGSEIERVDSSCRSFSTLSACGACYAAATSASLVTDSSCLNFTYIYAAGVANKDGPLDPWVAFCFFYLRTTETKGHHHVIIPATTIPAGTLLFVFLLIAILLIRRRRRLVAQEAKEIMMLQGAVEFTIDELKQATGGFSARNRIGSGGFSNVYKGTLANGTLVAVKRFKSCSPAGDPDFVNEVETVGSARHKNVSCLIGWCVHSSSRMQRERFIVSEFMSNGSLRDHLFERSSSGLLASWTTRKNVIAGIARGLAYLHSGTSTRIIHRDVKTANILLDEGLEAKISDMGLARFVPEDITGLKTGTVGTRGYVAPEYVLYEQLTDKSDVFSFGIVVLEVLSRKQALIPPVSTPIVDWAWELATNGKALEIFSAWNVEDEETTVPEMLRFLMVAFICAHPYVAQRPSMIQVVKMLEDGTGVPQQVPDRPVPFTWPNATSVRYVPELSFSSLSSRF